MTQKEFYNSAAWRRLSRTFLLSRNYICERCGKPAEIAHHKRYLTAANVNDPEISMNPALLEALCLDCHNQEHFGNGGATAAGLMFDEAGNLIREEKTMSKTIYNSLNETYETERADAISMLANITRRCRSDMKAYMFEPGCLEKPGVKMIEPYVKAQNLLLQLMREEMQDALLSDMPPVGAQDFESEVYGHDETA